MEKMTRRAMKLGNMLANFIFHCFCQILAFTCGGICSIKDSYFYNLQLIDELRQYSTLVIFKYRKGSQECMLWVSK